MADVVATTELTAEIVANYVANNKVAIGQLPALIKSIHLALCNLDDPAPELETQVTKLTAAQIKKSIQRGALISFLDGKPYKTLKRHLGSHGLTLSDYKERFGLPHDYPATAPDYSARRSAMALSLGLGKGGRKAAKPEPAPHPQPAPTTKTKRVKKAAA